MLPLNSARQDWPVCKQRWIILSGGGIEEILGGNCNVGCPPIFGEPAKVPPGAVFF